ncbi:MAG: hypothetical protein NTW87_15135 [Planctomycetota bacterium]|nr:hypothetical protein [Planctomycetota bacterium]
MRMTRSWLLALSSWLVVAACALTATCQAGENTGDAFLYLPPSIADRVVFYQSFENGVKQPEINLIGAKMALADNEAAKGLTGNGYMAGSGKTAKKKGGYVLQSAALSVHKPLTVMFWWRLDEPMKEETGFNIVALRGKGWISNFVAGKGPWCGLREPTYCFQAYNFPGMENTNDVWGGRVWIEPNVWHHAALTVSGAADIRIYWDAQLRTRHAPKGRLFKEGDTATAELGASGQQPAMTLDEVLVLDRALSADEIASYVTAVRQLAAVGFPFATAK